MRAAAALLCLLLATATADAARLVEMPKRDVDEILARLELVPGWLERVKAERLKMVGFGADEEFFVDTSWLSAVTRAIDAHATKKD